MPSRARRRPRSASTRHGGIHIVWANAGIGTIGQFALGDDEIWLRTVDVNVGGVFRFVRAALPHVVQRRG